MKKLPHFIIVGTAKAGTTSLNSWLNQHPDIFMPERTDAYFFSGIKHFDGPNDSRFNKNIIKSFEVYSELFSPAQESQIIGEKATDYLYYHSDSITNIKKYLDQNTKIIIVIRNPVDRAVSQYFYNVKRGYEHLSFQDALTGEEYRIKNNWRFAYHYAQMGFYYEQVKDYLDNFEKVKIILFEDMVNDPISATRNIYNFIGVKTNFEPDITHMKKRAEALIPRNKLILPAAKILERKYKTRNFLFNTDAGILAKKILYKKPKIDDQTLDLLRKKFLPDIKKVEKLTNLDLTKWKS